MKKYFIATLIFLALSPLQAAADVPPSGYLKVQCNADKATFSVTKHFIKREKLGEIFEYIQTPEFWKNPTYWNKDWEEKGLLITTDDKWLEYVCDIPDNKIKVQIKIGDTPLDRGIGCGGSSRPHGYLKLWLNKILVFDGGFLDECDYSSRIHNIKFYSKELKIKGSATAISDYAYNTVEHTLRIPTKEINSSIFKNLLPIDLYYFKEVAEGEVQIWRIK